LTYKERIYFVHGSIASPGLVQRGGSGNDLGPFSRSRVIFMQCAIADVSKDFDFLRLTREFTELTTHAVAKADGYVSIQGMLEITYLDDYFLLSVARVNQAFLKATS
jgi:hypothetical protein